MQPTILELQNKFTSQKTMLYVFVLGKVWRTQETFNYCAQTRMIKNPGICVNESSYLEALPG